MKKAIFLGNLLLISICANVCAMGSMGSGPFYFPGGTITPKSGLSISLKSLALPIEEGTLLDITCDIENPNYNKPYPVVIKLSTYMTASNNCSINSVTSASRLYLLNKYINKYRVRAEYAYWETLTFQNYDDTDTIHVTNCLAVYATS